MNRSRLTAIATAAVALAAAPAAHATAPANDHFSDAIALSGVSQPAAAPYSLISATKQIGEPASGGGHTAWFKWKPSTSGAAFADVCGAPTNHLVRVYKLKAGQPVMVYNLEGARVGATENADLPADSFCRFRWRAVKDTMYYVQIDSQGDVTSDHELIVDQDTAAPAQPSIDVASWPGITGTTHQAKFTGGAGLTFVCAYDSYTFKTCQSPHPLAGMDPGYHTFRVRTMDAHGNLSSIASRYWKVETGPRPATETKTETETEPKTETKTGGDVPPVDDPSFTDIPVRGGDTPGGGTTQTNGTGTSTGTTTATTTQQTSCRITLTASKRIKRAKLRRKGLKVKVAAVGEACAPEVFLKQRGRTVGKKALKLGTMKLKVKRARRGKVTVVAGATKLVVKVV